MLDVLIEETERIPEGQLRYASVLVVANFRDPRAVRFLIEELPRSTDVPCVRSMIVRLGEEMTVGEE